MYTLKTTTIAMIVTALLTVQTAHAAENTEWDLLKKVGTISIVSTATYLTYKSWGNLNAGWRATLHALTGLQERVTVLEERQRTSSTQKRLENLEKQGVDTLNWMGEICDDHALCHNAITDLASKTRKQDALLNAKVPALTEPNTVTQL